MLACGVGERGQHDVRSDPVVGGHVKCVARVVIEPGDHLDVGAGGAVGVGQSVVGEVGLPGLVWHLGLEPDVGRPGAFGRFGDLGTGADQDPVDRRPRQGHRVVVLQVPADRLGTCVQPRLGQLLAQREDEVDDRLWRGVG